MTAHRVARVSACALWILGVCLFVGACGAWVLRAGGGSGEAGSLGWVVGIGDVQSGQWLRPIGTGELIGSTLVTVGSGLVLREVVQHLRFPRLMKKVERGVLCTLCANFLGGAALFAGTGYGRSLAPTPSEMLLCLLGAFAFCCAYLLALGWWFSDEHLGLLSLRDMAHAPGFRWSAQAGYVVFPSVLADAYARKDVLTVRVLSRRLFAMMVGVLRDGSWSVSPVAAAVGSPHASDVSLAMVHLLTHGFSRLEDAPAESVGEAGALLGALLTTEAACAPTSEVRSRTLLDVVARASAQHEKLFDALWAGFLDATMRRRAHREATLVLYWRVPREWTSDDPRWVVRPAEQIVAFVAASAQALSASLSEWEASQRVVQLVRTCYGALARDVGVRMQPSLFRKGDARAGELPLALLDAIHARVLSGDLALTADARVRLIGEYEEARTLLTRALYGTATVRRAAAALRG